MGWGEHLGHRLGATLLVAAPGLPIPGRTHRAGIVTTVGRPHLPPVQWLIRIKGQGIQVVCFSGTIVPADMADIAIGCVHQLFIAPERATTTMPTTRWHLVYPPGLEPATRRHPLGTNGPTPDYCLPVYKTVGHQVGHANSPRTEAGGLWGPGANPGIRCGSWVPAVPPANTPLALSP